jgi:hypothetical protein
VHASPIGLRGGRRTLLLLLVVPGVVATEANGEEIFREVLAVASGEHTKSEGYGDLEFLPSQIGAAMRGSGT